MEKLNTGSKIEKCKMSLLHTVYAHTYLRQRLERDYKTEIKPSQSELFIFLGGKVRHVVFKRNDCACMRLDLWKSWLCVRFLSGMCAIVYTVAERFRWLDIDPGFNVSLQKAGRCTHAHTRTQIQTHTQIIIHIAETRSLSEIRSPSSTHNESHIVQSLTQILPLTHTHTHATHILSPPFLNLTLTMTSKSKRKHNLFI